MNKLAAIATRHWKPLLTFNLILLTATIGYITLSPKTWTAKAQFLLPETTSNLDADLGTLGSLRNKDTSFSSIQVSPLKVQASIMTSDAFMNRLWAFDPEKSKYSSLASYSKLFKVSPQEQSTIISVAVSGSSPKLAQMRSIAFTLAYQQRLNELRRVNGTAREQFNRRALDRSHKKLSDAQIALAQLKTSSGLVNSEEQTKGTVSAINTLTTVQAQVLAQAQSNENRIQTLSTRIGLTPEQAIGSLSLGENKDYQFIRQKLSEIEATLVQTQARYRDDSPQTQLLLSQRNELRRQLEQYIKQVTASTPGIDAKLGSSSEGRAALIQQLILAETESSAQRRQAAQLQSQIDKLNTTLEAMPVNQGRLLELQRRYDFAESVYKGLVAQAQQANIDAFNTYPNVQVLDSPTVDPKPSSPKKSLAAINGIFASVIGSIALTLFLESRNSLLKPKDLQTIKFPIVVRISRFKHYGVESALNTETEVEFQRLGSAVSSQFLNDRRLLVTSSNVGEGKTTVTLGLAKALADFGFQVLVVDGDFRKAELSRRLGHLQELTDFKQPISIGPRLHLLPTLPKEGKTVEFIAQGHFEQYIATAQSCNNYDYVLIDTAPVGITSETALMAAAVPNVLFVVRPGISDRDLVNDSLNQLAQHNAQLVGLAINGVETKTNAYHERIYDSVNS